MKLQEDTTLKIIKLNCVVIKRLVVYNVTKIMVIVMDVKLVIIYHLITVLDVMQQLQAVLHVQTTVIA